MVNSLIIALLVVCIAVLQLPASAINAIGDVVPWAALGLALFTLGLALQSGRDYLAEQRRHRVDNSEDEHREHSV